jgi:hypothetical protein
MENQLPSGGPPGNRHHDTDWGKWHPDQGWWSGYGLRRWSGYLRPMGSLPQEGPVERVTCKHCLRLLSGAYGGGLIEGKRNVTPNKTQLVALLQRVDAVEANWALETLAGAGEELTPEQCEHISDCLCKINDHAEISDDLLAETELMEATLIERVRELRNETLS